MRIDRNKRAKINGAVSLAYHIALLACGFIIPRLMIEAFGSEAYGATTSIAQLLAYIVLLEGGIGGVARAALYSRLAKNDTEGISAVTAEVRRFFRIVGFVFLGYVLILACSYKFISHIESLSWLSSFALVIAISISTFGQYFIGISYSVLLQAAQRSYISNAISLFATVLNTLCVILMIQAGWGLVLVKLASSIIFLLRPVAMYLYVRRRFKLSKPSEKGNVLKQKWDGLAQHIAFFLHSNTDIVVLTCFANLSLVAVYSVYNLVVSHLQNLVCSCLSGMEALFGDMLAKGEYALLDKSFNRYESLISIVAVSAFSTAAVLIVPFVALYTEGITDANYIAPLFSVLLILASLLYCLRMPYHSLVIAAGHFRQTQLAAYGEAAINVLLSILLVVKFGLAGVATATLLAVSFRFVYYAIYLSKWIVGRRVWLFARRTIVNALAFSAVLAVGFLLLSDVKMTSYFYWILYGAGISVMSVVVVLCVNAIAYHGELGELVMSFAHKRLAGLKLMK